MIHIVGRPGSGKTTLRAALTDALGITGLGIDEERARLVRGEELWPEDDRPAWSRLRRAALDGGTVIETSGLRDGRLLVGCDVLTILVDAPEGVRRERLQDRVASGYRLAAQPDYVERMLDCPLPSARADITWDGVSDASPVIARARQWMAS